MSEDYKVFKQAGGKITIVLHPTCEITKEDILILLGKCGFKEKDIFFILSDDLNSEYEFNDQTIILPLDENVHDNPELEQTAMHCANGGGTLVTLLGTAVSYDGLHPIAEKYGTQCNWDAVELKAFVTSPLTTVPISSSGVEIQRGDKDPVKC